jgi:negative regulator of sigma-B (phosphoserine phosphatase)
VLERQRDNGFEWGIAGRSKRGETTSGDLGVVALHRDGALVAAIDGVGHGKAAAHAARRAGDVVLETGSQDLVMTAQRCHDALRGTRGAAISLAFMNARRSQITWLGVGSVEGRVLSGDPAAQRPKGSLALRSGVPGHELPGLTTASLDIRPGDLLVLATDGIQPDFGESLDVSGSTEQIGERVVAGHWKPADDGLVVAVRFLGMGRRRRAWR